MITFWMHRVKYSIKMGYTSFFLLFFFFNVATRKFKIKYVAQSIFMLDSNVLVSELGAEKTHTCL